MKEKILLDTDIGNDIDDAVCLAYLLAQPECELLGITTVSGEPVKRAMIASAMCKHANVNIPIYPGTDKPLLIEQKQPIAKQFSALSNWNHDEIFPENKHLEFMREVIRNNPHEITLLCIGPMTNAALLFSIDPEIPKFLKRLVLMGGAFFDKLENTPYIDWNSKCDPHAASIIYNNEVDEHKSIGLDVTHQVIMQKDEMISKFNTGILRPVVDFSESFFKKASRFIFHDPLAAATIFDDRICDFVSGEVKVDTLNEGNLGKTIFTENSRLAHKVAVAVDRDRFLSHFFGVIESFKA